jgi:hypothetical protein
MLLMLPSARIWTSAVSPRLLGEEEFFQFTGRARQVGDPEDLARDEGVGQKPALPCPGLVDQGDTDVLDIVVDDVAEDEELDKRRDDEDRAAPLVPEELDELLADHFPDAQPAHLDPLAKSRSRLQSGEAS